MRCRDKEQDDDNKQKGLRGVPSTVVCFLSIFIC